MRQCNGAVLAIWHCCYSCVVHPEKSMGRHAYRIPSPVSWSRQMYMLNSHVSGKMCLSHPPTRTSTVSEQIYALATKAKSWQYTKTASKTALSNQMEEDSARSLNDVSMRDTRLNVALSGNPHFSEYGRFIPWLFSSYTSKSESFRD
jgi:hypothetical protein